MHEGRDVAEAAYLESYDPSAFERLSVAVDVVLLGIVDRSLRVLLVERDDFPFRHRLALPGGFVGGSESLDAAASRVLVAKAGLSGIFLEQLYTFGEPARDPRTRVIGVAYYALVDAERFAKSAAQARTSPAAIEPHPKREDEIVVTRDGVRVDLAFDHQAIVQTAVDRIRGKLDYAPIGYELLPKAFTLLDLQAVHEIVGGVPLNKDSFRRKMLASGLLVATGAIEKDVGHRPAALYRYVRAKRPRRKYVTGANGSAPGTEKTS